jgi:type I restriction enzyme M protein
LLKFAKVLGPEKAKMVSFFGQEINITTYNLCRINMFLHHVPFDKFDIQLGDTLTDPKHLADQPFDAIVSNPPYSLKWEGKDNAILINDERYAPAGVLAPKSAADLAFTMHMLWHLSERGTAAIVEFPGVLYRGGDEKKIRQYLIKNNFVDCVIQLPANLFFGVGIATCIIVLKKSAKTDSSVLFIDASKLFQKNGNKNILLPEHQDKIMALYKQRQDEQYLAKLVKNDDILENDANLSVSSYVEQEDTREVINITEVNAKLEQLVKEGKELNQKIEAIIKELGA